MPTLVWFNQPTNHSGTVNFLYLDPDGEIGNFTLYEADGGGPYILGGPALSYDHGTFTKAGLTLVSLLPAGFHIFPPSSEERIQTVVKKKRKEITDDSAILDEDDWSLCVYSKTYSTTQCCDMLLNNTPPDAAVVFVDSDEKGDVLLAVELARLYFGLSKERRKELKLGPDWKHHWEG